MFDNFLKQIKDIFEKIINIVYENILKFLIIIEKFYSY